MDKRFGSLKSTDKALHAPRDQDQIKHSQLSLLKQHVYGMEGQCKAALFFQDGLRLEVLTL